MEAADLSDEMTIAVKALVAQAAGVDADQIGPGTRLLEDLGLVGDDAALMLQRFAETFGVDLSGFVFSDHFPRDGWHGHRAFMLAALSLFLPRVRRQLFERRREERTLTLGHLVAVAEAKTWLRPVAVAQGDARSALGKKLDPLRRSAVLSGFLAFLVATAFFAAGFFCFHAALASLPDSGTAVKYLIAGGFSCAVLPVYLNSGWQDAFAYLRRGRPAASTGG